MLFTARFRKSQPANAEEQRFVSGIEDTPLTGRHGADGIAVIAVLHHHDTVALFSAIVEISQRHFQRHLNRRRAAVGIKHMA